MFSVCLIGIADLLARFGLGLLQLDRKLASSI